MILYMGNESESRKNRGKRGCKKQTGKIKPSWDAYFCLILEHIICVDFILLCSTLYKRILDICMSFPIIEILLYNGRSILDECGALIQLSKKEEVILYVCWFLLPTCFVMCSSLLSVMSNDYCIQKKKTIYHLIVL